MTGVDSWRSNQLVGLKSGYDIWKYFGIEGQFKVSGHDTTIGSTVGNIPFSFFAYQLVVQFKGMYPITDRLHIEGGLGGGLFYSSPNFNSNFSATRGSVYGEFGIEYFMRSRGISVGLDPSFTIVTDLKSAVIQATGFVRYTF